MLPCATRDNVAMTSPDQARIDLYRCLAALDALGFTLPAAHVAMAIDGIEREFKLPPDEESSAAESRARAALLAEPPQPEPGYAPHDRSYRSTAQDHGAL